MANDVLSGVAMEACPATDSLASDPAAFVANQTGISNDKAKLAFDESGSVGLVAKEKPTHFYVADDREVGMVVSPMRVAVQFKTGTPDASTLRELGLAYVRPVNSDYSVYEATDAIDSDKKRADLASSALVAKVAPVFVVQSSNSEAVLLDEVIVALKSGVKAEDYFKGNPNFSVYRPLAGTPDQFIATVADGVGEVALDVANKVASDPSVAWVSPNFYQAWQKYFIPNDTRFANQWHVNNVGQGTGLVDVDVDLPEAWDINQGGSAAITIGVVDDGVSIDHPDLDAWTNPGEIAGDGLDNDGNGWIDDVHGWNFVANNANSHHTTANDMHGTSVAGVAAAKGNNNLGVAGASYNSKVLSARIFEGNSVASDANIASALYYTGGRNAAGTGTWNAAAVVNNSWGGGATSAAINAALTWGTTQGRQGIGATYFFATGNGFGAVSEPALQSLAIPGVVAVGATNNKGELSDYSNFGPAVDIATPSNDSRSGYLAIDTTDRIGTDGYDPSDYTGTGANGFGGTSSATPLATGIAALALAQANVLGITLSPVQMRSLLRNNADIAGNGVYQYNPTTGKNNGFGYGRLNAASLLTNLGKAEISVTGVTTEYFDATSSVNFGSIIVGDSQELTFRIRNQGTGTLNLSSLTIASGPYAIVRGVDDLSLALGEATSFTVRYSPTAPGTDTRTLSILSSDSDEADFTFDLTATAVPASITGTVFEDWNGDGVKDAIDTGLGGRIVYMDTLANGALDTFATTTKSSTVSVPIVDEGTTTSVLAVSGMTDFITDVDVRLNITHTYDSDLDITLIAPNGKRILLVSRAGGANDNFTNTVFDDEATASIQSGTAPFTGSFKPFQLLSALDGLTGTDVNGTWTLEVVDTASQDEGTILGWDIIFGTGEQSTQAKATGFYNFLGLPNANYVVRTVAPTNWSGSGPTGGSYNVTIASPTDIFSGRDFGMGQNNKFYGRVFNDLDADGVIDATEAGLPARTLYWDANANGVYDSNVTTTLSNTTSLPIPDLSTVDSTITSTLTGMVTDVNVRLNITHTFDRDLDVYLIGPDGTQVELFTDIGGSGDDFLDTVLDQQAANVIGTPGFNSAPFTGTYRPEGDLSVLNGKLAAGVWTLRVTDHSGTDVGTLNNWDLIIGAAIDQPITTAADGTASLIFAAGTNQVRLAPLAGFANTVPTDGLRTVTVAGTPLFDQRFGSRAIATVANRGVFYNGATGVSASTSLATDKTALLPTQSSTYANYTNYIRGLNGIAIDIANLPTSTTNAEMLESLQFTSWDGISAAGFVPLSSAAVPSVAISSGGVGGASQVRITFPDNTVQNTWLKIEVAANDKTALATKDVFYFGNVIADFNVGNTTTRLRVNAVDTGAVRSNQSILPNSVGVTNIYDVNRDGRVNALDTSLVRSNQQIIGLVAPLTAPAGRGPSGLRGLNASSKTSILPSVALSMGDKDTAPTELPVGQPESLNSQTTPSLPPMTIAEKKSNSSDLLLSTESPSERSVKLESLDDYFSNLWKTA